MKKILILIAALAILAPAGSVFAQIRACEVMPAGIYLFRGVAYEYPCDAAAACGSTLTAHQLKMGLRCTITPTPEELKAENAPDGIAHKIREAQ